MSNALTKKCTRCKEDKRLGEFYENSTRPDHRNFICKVCQSEVDKQTRERRRNGTGGKA